jgi:antitoxin component YwqK of YwqJK toxin-antitoxin module
MKRITCVTLLVGALACTESNNKEEKDQTDRGSGVKHKKELKRYHANQTDQKKDGILVRDYSSNEPLTGVVYFHFANGQLAYERQYKNGLLDGLSISYYENGAKSSVGNFLNDQLHGKVVAWDENGNLEFERNYLEGRCIVGCN